MTALLIIALLFQAGSKPEILMDIDRVDLGSGRRAFLSFDGFSTTDLIEVHPSGQIDEPSVGIRSVAVRNKIVQHREKSYSVRARKDPMQSMVSFAPADVSQDAVIVVDVPQGMDVSIAVRTQTLRTRDFQVPVTFSNGRIEERPGTGPFDTLYQRISDEDLVVPRVHPAHPDPRVILTGNLELTEEERETLIRLTKGEPARVRYDATVTETGQVLDLYPLQDLPRGTPQEIADKVLAAAKGYSYAPRGVDGRAQAFTTTITLDVD